MAGELTRGAFLRHWRLMAIDGFELDVPDTPANAAAFGYPAGAREHPAFPRVRVVTIGECGSHAKVAAQMGPVGGKGASEQALARRMFGQLQEDWLLIADRGFYNWPDWQAAAATGAAQLWRVKADLRLPVLDLLPDGSYLSLVAMPTLHDKARGKLIAAARAGERLDPALAMRVRVIEYEIPDRDGDGSGELIALITTITDPALAAAQELAQAYCQRWEEETSKPQCCHNCGLSALPLAPSPAVVMIACWLFSQGRRRCCPRGVWWSARRRSTSAGPARTTVSLARGCR